MEWTFDSRIEVLRKAKLRNTAEKQKEIGSMDYDDWGIILPPENLRKKVSSISGSGIEINDIILNNYEPESNHESGAFFGPLYSGKNFGALMKAHPAYVNPCSSLAGAYMTNFSSYKKLTWNPDPEYDYSHLKDGQAKYHLSSGIGGAQHFCHDLSIGLYLGYPGLLAKIRKYRDINGPDKKDFYDGLEYVVLGLMDWIGRTADEAENMAADGGLDAIQKENLLEIAAMNRKLLVSPPETFREACQFMLWFQAMARMFNGNGALGRMDQFLYGFYERDKKAGLLTDKEASFHVACYLLAVSDYVQLGGYDGEGRDACNELSFVILEAMHMLRIPSNIGVCVGKGLNDDLPRRGVEIILEDKCAHPKFLGADNVAEGFARNGYPMWLARQRAYSGCHWFSTPGVEYTMSDMIKVNFARVFEIAFDEMMDDSAKNGSEPSVERLWDLFTAHIKKVVALTAEGIDFHIDHMHRVYPELVLDLCCYGPLERGLDASARGGVDYINIMIDGSGLATAADSFGAIAQVICEDKRYSFEELHSFMKADWEGPEASMARMYMKREKRYGYGGTKGDAYATRIADMFAAECATQKTPKHGITMISGLFSWALHLQMGRGIGATPNGRKRDEAISHGANPDPGFREDGAATALAVAVGNSQCGYGNCAPLQIDFEMGIDKEENAVEIVLNLIKTHFELGGTQINMNVADREKLVDAYEHPDRHPDLVVRVTGFSAFYGSLSKDMRKFVLERTLGREVA